MTVLALASDAYGSGGGVAQVNRDLYAALLSHGLVDRVRVHARVGSADGHVPHGVDVVESGAGMGSFLRRLSVDVSHGVYGAVVCGHAHLAPFAALAAARANVPWVLIAHGIEVWGPPWWPATQGRLATAVTTRAIQHADCIVAVSALTAGRVVDRFGASPDRVTVVPNNVDLSAFGPGPKRRDLEDRYGLRGRTVLMTLARLSPTERYKGIDEVLEALPEIVSHVSNVTYLVCGSGGDRDRLEAKAATLGVADRVVFAGYVAEEEKADHYRLADAFVMPGRGEGFGIVYLEALACGVPVVASSADASQEAVLNGEIGTVVNPDDLESLVSGVLSTLEAQRGVPDRLSHFSRDRFVERWHAVMDDLLT